MQMESSSSSPAIYALPVETLQQIIASLPLQQIVICRAVSKHFNNLLTSPCFLRLISANPALRLLALRSSSSSSAVIHAFDPSLRRWLNLPLDFIPFRSLLPVASSPAAGLLYLWASDDPSAAKSLLVCNPLTRRFRLLPHLGSAWSRHGSVLVDSSPPPSSVMVLTDLAALLYSPSSSSSNHHQHWTNFSSDLPSKPRSPIMVSGSVYALCDVGSPWRSQWKLFRSPPPPATRRQSWSRVERHEWGDVFDILKRPRLLRGPKNSLLMVGGLRSSFSLNSSCSTILILRLDLETLEWDEAGRMPPEMFRCFQESSKFKAFGAGDLVCFSAKRLRRLALWDRNAHASSGKNGDWTWIDHVPSSAAGADGGLCRGFAFQASLSSVL